MLVNLAYDRLEELKNVLLQLTEVEYTRSCEKLSHATIGEHTRHIIELFKMMCQSYHSGVLNYDDRERNLRLENDLVYAISVIAEVKSDLNKENKKIVLKQNNYGVELEIESNYYRELVYNIEHCVHHQALIKVALLEGNTIIDPDFGVANSTIEYRKRCAQ